MFGRNLAGAGRPHYLAGRLVDSDLGWLWKQWVYHAFYFFWHGGMLSLEGKTIEKRAWKVFLAMTKVWFCVKPQATPWGVNKGPINKQACKDFNHQRWKLPSKFSRKYKQATRSYEKNRVHRRSSPCMSNLQTIKQELKANFKWSNLKGEGSFQPSSAKVIAKKMHWPYPQTLFQYNIHSLHSVLDRSRRHEAHD
jgi:hypothetical protein